MEHRHLGRLGVMIGILGLLLAGCGPATSRSTTKSQPKTFAKAAQSTKQHIWLETNGKNVTADSTIAYLIVTQNGKVTVYRTGDAAMSSYNRLTDGQMIARAKRADRKSFNLKRQAAYDTSKANELALTNELKAKTIKSAAKRAATRDAIRELKERRWRIETAKYLTPKPEKLTVKVTTKAGKTTSERMIYRHYDYDPYLAQFTSSDDWIKNAKPGQTEQKIRPLTDFYVQTDGAKVVYRHRFHKATTMVTDKFIGYLEHKQVHGKKTPKEGTALIERVSGKAHTVFDSSKTAGVSE